MSGNTPTPWTIVTDSWQPWPGAIQIVGADGYVVAYTASGGPEKENAELLIKAASNHEALVKALEKISKQMTMGELIAEYGEDYLGDPEAGYDAIIMIARDALRHVGQTRGSS